MAYLYEDIEKKTGIFIKQMSLTQLLAINGARYKDITDKQRRFE